MYNERQPSMEMDPIIDKNLLDSIVQEALYLLESNKKIKIPKAVRQTLELYKIYDKAVERGDEVDLKKFYAYYEAAAKNVSKLLGKQGKTLDLF